MKQFVLGRGAFAVGMLALVTVAAVLVLGFDVHPAAAATSHGWTSYTAEFGSLAGVPTELKAVFDRIGEAFEAFKKTHQEEISGIKKGYADVVTADKLQKVSDSLDKAVEAKAALDAKVEAEIKHVDEIEKKLNRLGLKNDENGRLQLEVKEFNRLLETRGERGVQPLDETSYVAYKAASEKYLRKGDKLLSAEEHKTLAVGSDPDGGYFVTPDTSGRIVKRIYETSPVRQFANQQTISTDKLEGIEDTDEAGAGYAGERTTSGDTKTPQVGKYSIPVFDIDTEPKATQNLLDDAAVDVEAWLGGKVSDKFSRFENKEFVTGAANKIRGFVLGYDTAEDTGSGVAWGSVGYLKTGVDGDWAAANKADALIDVQGLLKNGYLQGAVWCIKRKLIAEIRKFKNSQGDYLWQPSLQAGTPEMILGYPVARMEDMPDKASNSFSIAFGNLKEAYTVVDRIGIRVLRDPFTQKPFIKFYTHKRTGGGLVNFEAIKLIKFGTA
ncbi:HK97 family phage major capsid protein [Bradyrhizobium japonicum]|uniref:phage major capsid protein n=1 Tax=Bradyrhizobium elkanii TaxID=29448 RepID=UPI00036799BD|nr:phage major capsid protein [Bradyrhizobium elkanii]WAX24347.1 major capsid protein [Bradyrhizobium phage ppBeUSDA76-1]MCP1731276.1 HK97 family phage major capsid protein [Bradyrhizobium elkanii]MCS3575405.1 HK97 family phage major capsid protein [Bradyrhizobium elkanii]MCS3591904.1 HK97 family phage major capsid protein [Bradyrhizobium elkanii]MCS3621349.1 HK97 family phage major capsid protein [Bradyrhizobium elkanii]